MKSQLEKKLEDKLQSLLLAGGGTDIDSPNGRKGQAVFMVLQSLKQERMNRYTLVSVMVLALAALATLIFEIINVVGQGG